MKRTDTPTLIKALRILAIDIQSDDGIANACISEGADRIQELDEEMAAAILIAYMQGFEKGKELCRIQS